MLPCSNIKLLFVIQNPYSRGTKTQVSSEHFTIIRVFGRRFDDDLLDADLGGESEYQPQAKVVKVEFGGG